MKPDAKEMWRRHRVLLAPVIYTVFYKLCFNALEEHVVPRYWISCALDACIPFWEGFILPYLLWFPLIPALFIFCHLRDRDQYRYLCRTVLPGLTICLVIYALFPNGQPLREPLLRDNIFCWMVEILRATDTPTNVCPSIHVFISVNMALSALRSRAMARRPLLRTGLIALCAVICASTVCLKQHSIIDVVCGVGLSLLLDVLSRRSLSGARLSARARRPARRQPL